MGKDFKMAYFKKFPIILNYLMGGNSYTVVDVAKRSFYINPLFKNPSYYIEYDLKEGDTPVMLADKLYDDVELAWVILHFNEIVDYYNEWPMEQESLFQYIVNTYDDPYARHHSVSIQTGNFVQVEHPAYDRLDVNNYEHETEVNDGKRSIRLIRTDYIGDYVNMHDEEAERL
jgi:hypothetical protein